MITNVLKGESIIVAASRSGSGLWSRLKRWSFRRAFGSPSVRLLVRFADSGCVELAIESDGMEVSVEDAETVSVPATEEALGKEFGDGDAEEGQSRPEAEEWRVDRPHRSRDGLRDRRLGDV